MKYIFRGNVIFEYFPDRKRNRVEEITKEHNCVFNFCSMIPEDYRLLSEFFDTIYRHTQGEDILLDDIEVN